VTGLTRANLLLLREKAGSVSGSIEILKGRRQALIREFLKETMPFLRSRKDIRKMYGRAVEELALSLGHEGRDAIESIAMVSEREFGIEITERSVWGLKYKDIIVRETPVRSPEDRGYDYRSTTPHLEECIHLFEKLLEAILKVAAYESKLKRLGDEILKTTRKIRVLEERVLPRLNTDIKTITRRIEEREKEEYYRLKRVKEKLVTKRRPCP
jgi:V/A-type H+-transporting ATPase subunit D